MDFIQTGLSTYNEFMSNALGHNDFLISAFTVFILGTISYLVNIGIRSVSSFLIKRYTTSVTLNSSTESYGKIMRSLKDTIDSNSRYFAIGNGAYGFDEATLSIGPGVQYIYILNKLCRVVVTMPENKNDIIYQIVITYTGTSRKLINKLMEMSTADDSEYSMSTTIYETSKEGFSRQRKELTKHRVLGTSEQQLISDIKDFVNSEDWYVSKGLPYKFGALIYGPPGTGKTSIIRAVAGDIDYDICVVTDAYTMDKIPSNSSKNLIIVLDEIDSIVGKRKTKSTDNDNDNKVDFYNDPTAMLRELDGIAVRHGTIVIATTNYKERLDDALLRDGRLGNHYEFKYTNTSTFVKFMKLYFNMSELDVMNLIPTDKSLIKCTGASIQGAFNKDVSVTDMINKFYI